MKIQGQESTISELREELEYLKKLAQSGKIKMSQIERLAEIKNYIQRADYVMFGYSSLK